MQCQTAWMRRMYEERRAGKGGVRNAEKKIII
jgi:hypothetical protein